MTLISRAICSWVSARNNKKPREGEGQGREGRAGERITPFSLAHPTQNREEGDAGLNVGIFFSTLGTPGFGNNQPSRVKALISFLPWLASAADLTDHKGILRVATNIQPIDPGKWW